VSRPRIAIVLGAALLAGGAVVWALRQRSNPSACPYSQRFFLDLPRPFLRRETLLDVLAPIPGERVLEVEPGTGYYSLHTARALVPSGRLVILDVQPDMLDETMRRAEAQRIDNIDPLRGDAQALPFPDATFDAAYLVATLGEIPDQEQALRELGARAQTGWPTRSRRGTARSASCPARYPPRSGRGRRSALCAAPRRRSRVPGPV